MDATRDEKGKSARMFRILFVAISALQIAGTAHAQDGLGCPDEAAAREQFASGELSKMPNYAENAGARVQKQHPDTHMFGQAKHISAIGRQAYVFCQYSNHVGLVATFGVPIEGTVDPLQGCDSAICRSKPWWRTEYVESNPSDEALMQVCVIDRIGETFPSVGCRFVVKPRP